MADGFNRFNPGGQYYYQNHNSGHARNLHHRNGSPINNSRGLFQPNADTPSPNRSPGTNSPAHTTYSMYGHNNHRQNHGLLNGGAGHQSFQPQMGLNKNYQSQAHAHQGHHVNSHNQDHNGIVGHSNSYGNHQHNVSASTLSNTTPHFTPANLQNGTPESAGKPTNEHWSEQMREYHKLRIADHKTHYYARIAPSVNRFPGTSHSLNNGRGDADEPTDRRRVVDDSDDMATWDSMDLSGQGLKGIAPELFRRYPKLRKLYLNWNKLSEIPAPIGQMRYLTILDLSMNNLSYLPPEIGMLTNLKKLSLYDNNLVDLPYELGSLFQLETLGIEGNPLRSDYKERIMEHGTQEMIRYLREEAPRPDPPNDRAWIPIIEDAPEADTFSVLSWNILCDRAATAAMYGYTPSEALAWTRRREMILDELTGREADIMCLQEVDVENFNEFFRPNLAPLDYKGIFWPKSRAQTMMEKEAKVVDGCAIFYKNSKYILLDKQLIPFSREAIARPDMKGEHDVYNRVMPRDHIAVVAFLENRQTGARMIVANTHLTWEPWFSDIKIVQVAIMMEKLVKLSDTYAKWPPCKDKDKELFKYANDDSVDPLANGKPPTPAPSMKYDDGTSIPLLVCGDFNSTIDSGVLELITQGSLASSHSELGDNKYGDFTRHGMGHPFNLKSAYAHINELPFTNYTPDFRKVIDWVFYSTNSVQVTGLLGEVDKEYMARVPGWPNHFFPSDHLPLLMQFALKEQRKQGKQVEADFGNGKSSSREGRGRENSRN